MNDGEFMVVEQKLTDGSKVHNVAGYLADGKTRLNIGCISLDQANELSAILRRVAFVEVAGV